MFCFAFPPLAWHPTTFNDIREGMPNMKTENRNLNLHVSTAGDNRWSGLLPAPSADGLDGPVATLAGARDVLRRLRTGPGGLDRPVTVHVADGVYELSETLLFTPEDGGTEACPIQYAAAAGAAPVVSGGHRIGGWRETQHANLRCWIADLPEVAAGRWRFTRLYVNDMPRLRPRLPKTGFQRFTGLAGAADPFPGWCKGPDRANFAPGEIRKWHNWEDAELVSYQLWFDTHHHFKSIDEVAGVAVFHAQSLGSLKDEKGEFARYFVENIFEALDTPGQWYLDRPAGRLYYLPLPNETPATTVVVAPRLTELVRLQGDGTRRVNHLRFENLAFAHQHWELPPTCSGYIQAAFGVPGAIVLEGAEACVFYGCTIAHVNGYGLEVLAGSTRNVMAACIIHDAGAGGFKVGHEEMKPHESAIGERMAGDFPAMATTIVDCTIRDCGHLFPSAIGIWVGNSSWNRLLHNHIFNCNYTGISCGWTWGYAPTRTVGNRIEYNHIHHINNHEILSDNGGIYTLGIQPGLVMRGNVIHDISCYGYGAWGIYPDEGSSGMLVEHNLVCGTKKAAYSMHYGQDNLVQHNIFALSQAEHICLGKREMHRSTVFRRNVCLFANGQITGIPDRPAQNTVHDNLYWTIDGAPLYFSGLSLASQQEKGLNIGSVVADPLFADAAGSDFSMRADSPAKGIGFHSFDWRAAGRRLKGSRPTEYGEYLGRFPIPPLDAPVVRTQIELMTPLADVRVGGLAVFEVRLTNLGRAAAKGIVRLVGGPKGATGRPSARRIAFALAPGEKKCESVSIKVKRGTCEFWLDCEPADDASMPARGLVVDYAAFKCPVPQVPAGGGLESVGAALSNAPVQVLRQGGRVLAEVKWGASEDGFLFTALYHEPVLRPNVASPWLGTAFEVQNVPSFADTPADRQRAMRKIFIVPHGDGCGAETVIPAEGGNDNAPAPNPVVDSHPISDGCEVTVIIPWKRLGYDGMPANILFEMIVYGVDPATNDICYARVFDWP